MQGIFRVEKMLALHTALFPDATSAPAQLDVSWDVCSGSSMQVWSDYLSVQLHPRSIYVIQQYNHNGYVLAEG